MPKELFCFFLFRDVCIGSQHAARGRACGDFNIASILAFTDLTIGFKTPSFCHAGLHESLIDIVAVFSSFRIETDKSLQRCACFFKRLRILHYVDEFLITGNKLQIPVKKNQARSNTFHNGFQGCRFVGQLFFPHSQFTGTQPNATVKFVMAALQGLPGIIKLCNIGIGGDKTTIRGWCPIDPEHNTIRTNPFERMGFSLAGKIHALTNQYLNIT